MPWWLHAAVVAWVVGMLAFARVAPDRYYAAMQEDRAVEWGTAALFAAAALLAGSRAWRRRPAGDALVALFCVAAAGEEISWGQRLLGYTPPDIFLANNAQQEANLHNLVEAFGQPKWSLIAILVAYGILAPALARVSPTLRHATHRFGFTPPPLALAPWFAALVVVLMAYPVRFTGEWGEALAGLLFVAALRPSQRMLVVTIVGCTITAFALETLSARALAGDPGAAGCARAEAAALASALASDPTLAVGLPRRLHRRVWSVVGEQQDESPALAALRGVACSGAPAANVRRRRMYAVDPWGTAYWMRVTTGPQGRNLTVYSFGPNRRRDDDRRGDDIARVYTLPPR